MACNCNKELTTSECYQMRKKNDDKNYTFIYHYFTDKRGLVFANVPKGANPNSIAEERGFYNDKNQLEWFYTNEHPCTKNEQN